jgi:predicted HicB family RNase H-like nuclease
MDPVTMNQNLETDETKFLDAHGTCTFQPQDLVGLHFFTSPMTKEFLLNETKPKSIKVNKHRHSKVNAKVYPKLLEAFFLQSKLNQLW